MIGFALIGSGATMLFLLNLTMVFTGLTLPGYLLMRALGLRHSWFTAFPVSALLLSELVIGSSIVNVPIRFGIIASCLCLLGLVWYLTPAFAKYSAMCYQMPEAKSDVSPAFMVCCVVPALLVVAALTFRTTLYPLSGYDTLWRWEALARDMLQHESLSYYPPVTARDFSIYFFADGIPPLVSSVYWWLYAGIGKPLMNVTSLSVVLQLVSVMGLSFYATLYAFGSRRAALLALFTIATTTLLLDSFAIGQETGFTALSVAGQLCFAYAAVRKTDVRFIVVAALFGTLGALSRDYGPMLSIAGLMVLAWYPHTRRFLPLFIAIVVVLSCPWYLRSWALTGNPLYSHQLPGGFPVNAIQGAIMESFKEIYSVSQFDGAQWLNLFVVLFCGAPVAIFAGIPYGMACWRDTAPIMLTAGVIILLWVLSIGLTSGGLVYSMRVLSPAFVALSMVAGAALNNLVAANGRYRPLLRVTVMATGLCCSLYAIVFASSHPLSPRDILTAITIRHNGPPDFSEFLNKLTVRLEASALPSTGVLTDDYYLAIMLKRNTRFRPVMVWSPEVKFVFDSGLNPLEIRNRLLAKNIRLVSIEPNQTSLFLSRVNFYTQDRHNWSLLFTEADRAALYLLPAAP